jgi:hypothetical protein
MLQGEMILYESHSILHGRPFPPQGMNESSTSDLPPYIIPGSLKESNWRREHPEGFNPNGNGKKVYMEHRLDAGP